MMANDGRTSSMGGVLALMALQPVEHMAGSTRASYTPHTIRASCGGRWEGCLAMTESYRADKGGLGHVMDYGVLNEGVIGELVNQEGRPTGHQGGGQNHWLTKLTYSVACVSWWGKVGSLAD